jgi:hypothetical protein
VCIGRIIVLQQRRLVEQARSKTARLRRGGQPQAFDGVSALELGAGRPDAADMNIAARSKEQKAESEEIKEVAPFPVEIDP